MSYLYKEKIGRWYWYEKEEVTSTNDEIRQLPELEAGVVLSAVRQTAGRGRRGHLWHAPAGNLYFTYSWHILPEDLSRMVCLIGLSLAETVLELSSQAEIKIKWPNDVFLNHKKISGILLENIAKDLWIIGIGVNIVSAPQLSGGAYQATSLQENDILISREAFLRRYLLKFEEIIAEYAKEGFTPLKKRWLNLALNYQQPIMIKGEKEIKKGVFLTLDDKGYLVLKTKEGEERIVAGDLFI